MIEIKISTDAAVNLLIERINYEYKLRVVNNILPAESRLDELEYKEILKLAETAAVDLVFLLPVEALIQKSNLTDILVKSFKTLARIYRRPEFALYSPVNVASLLKPIRSSFKKITDEESYKYN